MIAKTLMQVVDGLNAYLTDIYPAFLNQAQLKTVTKESDSNSPGIAVTLINVEEDKVCKNHLNPLPERSPANLLDPIHPLGGKPAMRVNLYVLFAFNPVGIADSAYVDSLVRLNHVLTYFQSLPYQRIVIPATLTEPGAAFNLEINYHNISLEDSNNMWSNPGGEQKPCAMYQMKMIEIESRPPATLDAVIAVPPEISNPGNGDNTIQNL